MKSICMRDSSTPRGGRRRDGRAARRRGLILPVMLVILLLLGLMAATFSLQTQAEYAAGRAMADRVQCRLAAEAGVQKVMMMLRSQRDNIDAWYHNPEEFDQVLVWSESARIEEIGESQLVGQELEDLYAFRFSIVADDPTSDELEEGNILLRFGITDEAAKLNINTATEEQLLRLIGPAVPVDAPEEQQAINLVHALLDWRDEDDDPHEFGAETQYYQGLLVPYRAKNAPFETVEELLMVRGFNGRILYGEDYDRNGLMTENEDDGELSFPMDDGDGVLNRGLMPYITVYSQEFNVANDNKRRINLFGDPAQVRKELEDVFEDQQVIDFIIGGTRKEGTEQTRSLADYLGPRVINNTLTPSPVRGAAAAALFDKCTLDQAPEFHGRINVATAPPRVLRCIEYLSEEKIPLILQKRATLTGPIKSTTAWLVTEQILDPNEYALVQSQITSRARQFTVEAIGFTDHSGVFVRLQAVLNMRGPLAQIVYYRDLTKLGMGYPVYGEEGDRSFVNRDR